MKLKPLTRKIEDIGEDYEKASRYDRWRVGQLALYMPDGFQTAAYLPLEDITNAYPHDYSVRGGNCCAGTIVTGGVVVRYKEDGVINIIPGNSKAAYKLLDALKERLPDLDTQIPDIYKDTTRMPV